MGHHGRLADESHIATAGSSTLVLLRDDITLQNTDAIVNAANSGLLGGGGVDGAIHRAGGPEILRQCREIRAGSGRCPPGAAVITGGGNLPARFVIHAVGPVWHGGSANEREILRKTYDACLTLALSNDIRSLSFPSISTGAYRFPAEEAARIAFVTVRQRIEPLSEPMEIRFIVFSEYDEQIYRQLFAEYSSQTN
ncbi:MAG: O-acetyl-ADP-ribose deacetylase [Ignavibacteria bacterium]|nr:O-acetyl-ADP-ribose deacetylase [Ignavibacteria bacterium]